MKPIVFAYNPTSWRRGNRIERGMADSLAMPIAAHLPPGSWTITDDPQPGSVNVYFAHRSKYDTRTPPGETSVFISHGIADKAWRNAPRMHGKWDYICVSGPWWTRKMLTGGIPRTRILEVGYTKLDPIWQSSRVPGNGQLRVLWAPTHAGSGEPKRGQISRPVSRRSSWMATKDIADRLPFDVTVAPHPRHRPDKRSTLEEYLAADVVVADSGSTIYEAWALDLPVVFPSWMVGPYVLKGRNTLESRIYRNQIGYHVGHESQFVEMIEQAAAEGIGQREQTLIEDVFPRRYRGDSGRLHAEALIDIAHGREPRGRP